MHCIKLRPVHVNSNKRRHVLWGLDSQSINQSINQSDFVDSHLLKRFSFDLKSFAFYGVGGGEVRGEGVCWGGLLGLKFLRGYESVLFIICNITPSRETSRADTCAICEHVSTAMSVSPAPAPSPISHRPLSPLTRTFLCIVTLLET